MKTEKIYIGGIETYRTVIELTDKARTVIKVESWSKSESKKVAEYLFNKLKEYDPKTTS